MSCNCRSLQAHFTELKDLIINTNCSVLALQEIWQIKNVNLFNIPGYDLVVNQRKKAPGGGTAFYVKSGLDYEVTESKLYEKIFEYNSISIKRDKGKPLKLFNIYIGHKNKTDSLLKLQNMCNLLSSNTENVLLGDFNIDLLKTNRQVTELSNLMIDIGLTANIRLPSRIETMNGTIKCTLIDNIFTRPDLQGYYYSITDKIADHYIQGFDLTSKTGVRSGNEQYIEYRNFSSENMDKVKELLTNVDWQCMCDMELDEMVSFLTNTIRNAIDKTIPIKKIKKTKKMDNVWFTKGMQKSKLTLRKLEKRFAKYPFYSNKIQLENYYKTYKSIIRKAKNSHYYNLLNNSWGDSRKQWETINEICGKLSKDTRSIKSLKNSFGTRIIDNKKMAEEFGKYFSNIGPSISNKYNTHPDYLNHIKLIKTTNNFNLKNVTISHTKKTISKLKNKK